jgi:hypothetical protein
LNERDYRYDSYCGLFPAFFQDPHAAGLRLKYREIQRRVEILKRSGSIETDEMRNLMNEMNELHLKINRPKEELMDVQLFSLTAETALQYGKRLVSGNSICTPADLIRRLKTRYVDDIDAQEVAAKNPNAFAWAKLGATVAGLIRPAPLCFHMLGPMNVVPKPKRQAAAPQKRKREPLGEAVRPDEVKDIMNEAKQAQQETDRLWERMWEILGEQPDSSATLITLVLNHESFSQTVENMFALSFLVKEGRVELVHSDEGVVVKKVSIAQKGANGPNAPNAGAERLQFIVGLDFSEYEIWKSSVGKVKCLMPHRPRSKYADDVSEGEEGESPIEDGSRGKQKKTKL